MRLLCRKSKLTNTGNRPYDGGTSPERWLKERFRVPVSWVRLLRDSGREPSRKLADKSKWARDRRDVIWCGMGPAREL